MKEVDFSNFNPDSKSKGGNGITFLRFESDKTYRVRPFASAVEFYKIFVGQGKPSIIVDPDDKDEAAKLLTEACGKEMRPSYRNAMFVIDRADSKIKIMEGGVKIFESFANWSSAAGIKPGSGQAGDWQIVVKGSGLNRTYDANFLGTSMFTEEEKQLISSLKAADKLKMSNYLKEVALDKVVETALGTKEEPAPQEAVAATSNDDFDF